MLDCGHTAPHVQHPGLLTFPKLLEDPRDSFHFFLFSLNYLECVLLLVTRTLADEEEWEVRAWAQEGS